jgi:restriction system protein
MTKNKEQPEGAQFVRYFGPLLDALRKLGGSGAPSEVVAQIAEDLRLSEQEQSELLDSGAPRFPNQVAWARFYLTREGLLDASKRGVWSLTEKGRGTHLSGKEGARHLPEVGQDICRGTKEEGGNRSDTGRVIST